MDKQILVFAPHPDDETLGCGGTIAKRISEGYKVLIVVMTDGRNSLFKDLGIASDPTPEEVKEIRREEVKRATSILGVGSEDSLFLDFVDGSLEKFENEAQEKVLEIIRENRPLEVYFPCKKDCHPDHRATNRIVNNATRELNVSAAKCRYMIAYKYARIGPYIEAFLDLIRRGVVYVDVSQFLPLKEAAVNEFKSELSIISSRQSRPRTKSFKKFLRNREKFYTDT